MGPRTTLSRSAAQKADTHYHDTMGTYNHTVIEMHCPRCSDLAEIGFDLYLGDTSNMVTLNVGDVYPFHPRKAVQNGGCPESGDVDGKAYAECPLCCKDFYAIVRVRDRRLLDVVPDMSAPPHII